MGTQSIYEELGVPTVVNAAGTKTRVGGSRMRSEAVDAMARAAESFVRLSDLQALASERIAAATGAEAGYVTNGAAGGLLLSAAACIAGTDPGTMSRLPDTAGVGDEIVMPRTHRSGYDHALRTAGATVVDVGANDHALGTGARDVALWEYEAAITADTVAIAHVHTSDGTPPLSAVCALAHDHDLPVIVDAAAELPPVENLSWFTDQGADLVAFSGGKAVRGPQTTGILAGRADLVESVAVQHLDMHVADAVWDPPAPLVDASRFDGVPNQGVGRALKVGKEELVGLLAALDAFLAEDHAATRAARRERASRIAATLDDVDGLTAAVEADPGASSSQHPSSGAPSSKARSPTVTVRVDGAASRDAASLALALRREDPRVFVGTDDLHREQFTVDPACLTDEEARYVVERVRANLADATAGSTGSGTRQAGDE